jgi:hypothetical protein
MYFVQKNSPKLSATYLAYYNSLMLMCQYNFSITTPSIIPYGNENINLAREIALNRLHAEIGDEQPYKIPQNYYPLRAQQRAQDGKLSRHPPFNPEDIKFFRELGREVQNPDEL